MAKILQAANGTILNNPTNNAWGSSNAGVDNTGWGINQPGSTGYGWNNTDVGFGTVGAVPSGADPYGVNVGVGVSSDVNNIDVEAITTLIKQAINLYDTGKHDKKLVATEVDALRKKINNKAFDWYNSVELRNIFGYILGDVVSELTQTRGTEYDIILDLIFNNFPEGTGNPVESKYVSKGSKYAGTGTQQQNKLINDIRKYINKNGFKVPTTIGKFLKIWEQFKLSKPELDSLDVQELFRIYNNNK